MNKQTLNNIIIQNLLGARRVQNYVTLGDTALNRLTHKELIELKTLSAQYCKLSHKLETILLKD